MKLGICYNLFNGLELLEDSLKNIQNISYYIVLVYQQYSNYNTIDIQSEKFLNTINKNLYNDLIIYKPNFNISPQLNETNKRNIGLQTLKQNFCTHFLCMDCDEFYKQEQIINTIEDIKKFNFDITYAEYINYFHKPWYQMIYNKKMYVPFISKIYSNTEHILGHSSHVLIDPTRRINTISNFKIYQQPDIIMHHMSYIRNNSYSLKSKLENSPNVTMFKNSLNNYIDYFENWKYGMCAMTPHEFLKPNNINNIKIVEPPINLNIEYKQST